MVLVDIYVTSLDKTYQFSLNERVPIRSVILEITEMIEQKERVKLNGDSESMRLYNPATASVLPVENSLADCYIRSGQRLIFV